MQITATWPRAAFRSRTEDWHLEGTTPSVGGILGPGAAIHVENRIWRVTADLTTLQPDQWRALRSVFDLSRGRYGVIRVPVITADPRATTDLPYRFDKERQISGLDFQNASLGRTGVAGLPDEPPPQVVERAQIGATEILLSVSPVHVAPGAMFSLPGDRVYRAVGRVGGRLQIEPPLRAVARPGDVAQFEAPWARMRIDMDNPHLKRASGRLTQAMSIPLIEALG